MTYVLSLSLEGADPESSAYRKLLQDYIAKRLGLTLKQSDDKALIDQIIALSDARFAYVAFLVSRIQDGSFDKDTLASFSSAGSLYKDWLESLDAEYGDKRADALRWLLALMLALEAAHARVFTEDRIEDPVDGSTMTSLSMLSLIHI